MKGRLTEEQLFEVLAGKISTEFAKLLQLGNELAVQRGPAGRRGVEDMMGEIVCDNLCVLIAMACPMPQAMVDRMYHKMKSFDFDQVKIKAFGFKLGVVPDGPKIVEPAADPMAPTVNIGPSNQKG